MYIYVLQCACIEFIFLLFYITFIANAVMNKKKLYLNCNELDSYSDLYSALFLSSQTIYLLSLFKNKNMEISKKAELNLIN